MPILGPAHPGQVKKPHGAADEASSKPGLRQGARPQGLSIPLGIRSDVRQEDRRADSFAIYNFMFLTNLHGAAPKQYCPRVCTDMDAPHAHDVGRTHLTSVSEPSSQHLRTRFQQNDPVFSDHGDRGNNARHRSTRHLPTALPEHRPRATDSTRRSSVYEHKRQATAEMKQGSLPSDTGQRLNREDYFLTHEKFIHQHTPEYTYFTSTSRTPTDVRYSFN